MTILGTLLVTDSLFNPYTPAGQAPQPLDCTILCLGLTYTT